VIKDDLQYELTKAVAERFERALVRLRHRSSVPDDVHPLLRKAQEDSICSELETLRSQLRVYEHAGEAC
jgi:hypothetical protein